MRHLRHCLHPKVIAALVVIVVGVWVFAPGASAAALPVLVLAVCPLSMLALVLLMRDGGPETGPSDLPAESSQQAQGWSDDAQDQAITTLRMWVAELEARLAAASRPGGASGGSVEPASAVRDADR